MSEQGIGASLPRVEDEALLRGNGNFIDDINLEHQAYAGFVRSDYASATVATLDVDDALGVDGAVAVLTPDDLQPDSPTGSDSAGNSYGFMPSGSSLTNIDGTAILSPDRPVLTRTARFVGDTLAMVVADSQSGVDKMIEAINITYADSEPVLDPLSALASDSALVWPELNTNCALEWSLGDGPAVDAIFADAAHTVRNTITNNRVMVAALEPRGALASYDTATQRYTLWTPTQGSNQVKREVARSLLIDPEQLRVITPDVGGGFGIKNSAYPEQILVVIAAKRCGRPVKWYASRSDAFLCDYHARDHVMQGELAVDKEGHFLALRSRVLSNMGAYLTGAAPIIPTAGGTRMLANVYRTPAIFAYTRCVYTNTAPIAAYRGAGKPEYAHLVETLVDAAASQLQIDPIELRRRNMISPDSMPWTTPTGMVYDSGQFEQHMNEAIAYVNTNSATNADAALDYPNRQSYPSDVLRGRGFSVYTEPDGYMDNHAHLSFDATGRLTVTTTAQTNGQGHFTTYTQIAHSLLGVDVGNITVLEGDSDVIGPGSGSGGSRSTTVTGAAMRESADVLIEKGKRLAGHLLETSAQDITFSASRFVVSGTDQSVGWSAISDLAHDSDRLPDDIPPGLAANHHYDASAYCYPCGCHVCDVEIDIETGTLTVTRYISVSDFGTIVSPMMVAGQLHGGIAQGIGQAIYEYTAYDPQSGQLLSGSFMDYCIPRATQVPSFEEHFSSTRCLTNPLGVKGCGESGPTSSLPALENAVMHALRNYDTRELRMPFTPQRIWKVIHQRNSNAYKAMKPSNDSPFI